ncbi:MAG TPA: DUF1800 family protein [Verrucomicrobiae bacterium]|nr:DUF1800 family protein [Verrucomicrobiae bacterium]
MKLPTPSGCWRRLLYVMLVMVVAGRAGAQMVDLNHNGMSDIWELIYGASALDPNGDADGDGASNRQESIAGTNPFDSNSVPRITVSAIAGTNFSVSMASALGKQYSLQVLQAGPGTPWTNWVTLSSLVVRTGTVVTLEAPANAAASFFRIGIADVDSDGDGVNDWEEYQLKLDPLNPYSNGQLDASGQVLGDYAYVVGKLGSQNVVTISATDPTALEPDLGQVPINTGVLTVTRGGFPLNAITVNLTLAGPGPGQAVEGLDFAALPRTLSFPVGVSSQTISVTPLANTNLLAPVLATVQLAGGTRYSLGRATRASIAIYPSATANGTGLTGQYFTNSSSTYSNSANFKPANLVMTRVDPTVDFVWGTPTSPITNSGYYTVRWTGQVEPEYSETYYFDANTDDGVRVWVNNQLIIDSWVTRSAADSIGTISLQGGVRYNIQMDYFQSGGNAAAHLSWYSPSQPKQVIPSSRLYPASVPPAPAAVTSPQSAVAFLGQPFSFTVTGANGANAFTAGGLPPGLNFNGASGVISGIPTVSGDYQVALTASNPIGLGAGVLDLLVIDTGSSVTREVWLGVPGTNVADIPVSVPASQTNTLATLEGITGFGQNYGERVRGYFTAPVTGNYYFWIAGSDAAELWISNDGEPVNKVRRAYVSPAFATAPRQWTLEPSQQSPWLTLVAGQQYYLEILHKAGSGTNDNWSVGWVQDPTGTNTVPGGVVPGYVLSRYFAVPTIDAPGTLYTANLLASPGVNSPGVGSATLRLSADGSQAVLNFHYSGLTAPVTGRHIHSDTYLSHASQIMFDIDTATQQPDGSYVWQIGPVGTLQPADIVEIIREGKAYLNVHTVNYPAGEISGNFTLAAGTETFVAPPPPPAWTDDSANSNAAARFLIQATFGPSPADIATVQALGYAGWLSNQFNLSPTHHLPLVLSNASPDPSQPYSGTLTFNTWWRQSVTAPDQLRQRVAFALSEIMVVSQQGVLANNAQALSSYYDTLLDNAFGNFRSLLEAVTLSPAMGMYLNMQGNDMGSMITGIHANENYAREIQQLFSIGLNRMWPDGTLVMNSQGSLVPTYNQNVIMGFASVFTGWNYHQANQANGRLPTNFYPPADYVDPMVLVPTHHELGTKLLLDNVMLPQAWGNQANSATTNFDLYGLADLESALDSIFNNQNMAPFICRQLIQRLVTSNPSREYIYRVAQVFNDNGSGVRGDMKAVINAIFLDYEARSSALSAQPTFGKMREPLLRVTAVARAFPSPPANGGTYLETTNQLVSVSLTNLHRLNNGDTVFLSFTDTSSQPAPPGQGYSVSVTSPNSFTFNAPGLSSGIYGQTNNTIAIAMSGHGLNTNNWCYLTFTTGGATNGVYQVVTVPDSSHFTVAAIDPSTLYGSCLLSKLSGGGYIQSRTNVTFSLSLPHELMPGTNVFVHFSAAGSPASGLYQVATVPDATHFTIVVTNSANKAQNGQTIYPLAPPALARSGNVSLRFGTWSVGTTDTGSSAALDQTPLNSPTVFNFFYPDFQFPGVLASAGLTTPEFQLTSDTSVAWQMNFLEGGLLNNTGNTNGISSFVGGNGAVVLDLGPWMTPAYTADAGIPSLVNAFNSLLTGGNLSTTAKNVIVAFVANTTNFPLSSPPTYSQMRDRVRAVAHLIAVSPDFTIQR